MSLGEKRHVFCQEYREAVKPVSKAEDESTDY